MQEWGGKILVTVGTTEFDALTEYTDSQQFIDLITSCGFKEGDVTYQFGTTGKYTPKHSNQLKLSPNIMQVYSSHGVVISHGGAGTLLACLNCSPQPRIIAVANNTLAGNHQMELIGKLAKQGHILGFSSVEQFKNSSQKVKDLLSGTTKLRPWGKEEVVPIFNQLVFGDHAVKQD